MDMDTERELILALARREGTARELGQRFGLRKAELAAFVEENRDALEIARESAQIAAEAAEELAELRAERDADEVPPDVVMPADLADLWITKKTERLARYQVITDKLYRMATSEGMIADAVILRELRFFLRGAAEELGQLLHRGSGDSGGDTTLNYTLNGVDMDNIK